jgi:hypothetical protein
MCSERCCQNVDWFAPMGGLRSRIVCPGHLQVVPYEPVPCKSCGAILNPYSRCDFTAKLWICPFCHARNHFPAHYQVLSMPATVSCCRASHVAVGSKWGLFCCADACLTVAAN